MALLASRAVPKHLVIGIHRSIELRHVAGRTSRRNPHISTACVAVAALLPSMPAGKRKLGCMRVIRGAPRGVSVAGLASRREFRRDVLRILRLLILRKVARRTGLVQPLVGARFVAVIALCA